MQEKLPKITEYNLPKLLEDAKQMPQVGVLKTIEANQYTYLNIDDSYIHHLYPLLESDEIQKPRYFGKGLVGAHISVIYPEEKKILKPEDVNKEHAFEITNIVSLDIEAKRYYALAINSPSLVALRKKYDLPEKLSFKNYSVPMHLTIGVIMLK